jgi:hypothetical protein
MTSENEVVATHIIGGVAVRICATPPTRFGVLYYIDGDPTIAWATPEAALAGLLNAISGGEA